MLVSTLRNIRAEFWVLDLDAFGCDWSVGLRRDLKGVLLVRCTTCVQSLKAGFKV